jgi:hypothetical protein
VTTILTSVPSVASPATAVDARWRGYLAPAGALGTSGFGMFGFGADVVPAGMHAAVALAAVDFAALPFVVSTEAADATAAAVAGTQPDATAPKQAEKLVVTRNDLPPYGNRPGEPPA